MIKNIVFDLGNVILSNTPSSVLDFFEVDLKTRQLIENHFFSDFRDLDLGNITLEEHFEQSKISSLLDDDLKEKLLHYFQYRFYNHEVLDLMRNLKLNGYDIYILSNNNKETVEYLKTLPFFQCISGWIVSYEYHLLKPDEKIYQKLFDTYHLNPSECFFIDDSLENVRASQNLGMRGHVFYYDQDRVSSLIKEMKNFSISTDRKEEYVCKIASLDEVIQKYDYEIEHAKGDKDNWIIWKEEAIEETKSGRTIPYYGVLNGQIICEATAAIHSSVVQNADGLVDHNTAYLFAFRTIEEYQGKGYFSKLFSFLLDDLRGKGYQKVTLGVEPDEIKNKEIYSHYGFNEFIKIAKEVYPNGEEIEVEYYAKYL